MKVFISWSGEVSKSIAAELNEWLPMVIQNVQTFMSAESIEKGTRWANVISKELEDTSVGIIVLTAENIKAPWIYFEAGALAKSVDDTRLHSILFGIKPSDVGTPLSQFQITRFEKQDVFKLLTSINDSCGDDKLPVERLSKIHDRFWTSFAETVTAVMTDHSGNTPVDAKKPEADIASAVQEILVLARQQNQIVHSPERILSRDVIEEIVRSYNLNSEDPRRRYERTKAMRDMFKAWAQMNSQLESLEIPNPELKAMMLASRSNFDRAFSGVMETFDNTAERAKLMEDDSMSFRHKRGIRMSA